MIALKLVRFAFKDSYTIGRLFINDNYFCDTLEDVVRHVGQKVHGKTAIPAGTYKIVVNRSPKFKRDLPRLLNVPGFDGILIHRGNTAKDTSGCILVGENKAVGELRNSTQYESLLVNILKGHADIEIQIYNKEGSF